MNVGDIKKYAEIKSIIEQIINVIAMSENFE